MTYGEGFTTITDAYAYFTECHGEYVPLRSQDELQSLIHAAELRYEEVGERFWGLAFGDYATGGDSWAAGTVDWPTDAQWARFDDHSWQTEHEAALAAIEADLADA